MILATDGQPSGLVLPDSLLPTNLNLALLSMYSEQKTKSKKLHFIIDYRVFQALSPAFISVEHRLPLTAYRTHLPGTSLDV